MKKMLSLLLALVMCLTLCVPAFAFESGEDAMIRAVVTACSEIYPLENIEELESAYRDITEYAFQFNDSFNVSLERFIADSRGYALDAYLQSYLDNYNSYVTPISSAYETAPRSGDGQWFYNTGTSLPQAATYSKYSLMTSIRAGDIYVEHNTAASGITGHAGQIEGKFWSAPFNMYYLRVVEGIVDGVCRGVMDDTRVDYKETFFYRYNSGSIDAAVNSVMWAVKQLGKPYNLHPTNTNTSASHPNWYCSELVYAAYLNQGVNILPNYNTSAFVYPYWFEGSSVLTQVRI